MSRVEPSVQTVRSVPATLRSRSRIYVHERLRRRLDIGGYGHGVRLGVALTTVDHDPEWGTYAQSASFERTLGVYGEFTVPAPVRRRLGLVAGDTVRLTLRRLS